MRVTACSSGCVSATTGNRSAWMICDALVRLADRAADVFAQAIGAGRIRNRPRRHGRQRFGGPNRFGSCQVVHPLAGIEPPEREMISALEDLVAVDIEKKRDCHDSALYKSKKP